MTEPFFVTEWARVMPLGQPDEQIVLACIQCREQEPVPEWIFACSEICFRNALIRLKPETLEMVVAEIKALSDDTSTLSAGEILATRQDLS